MSRNSVKLIFGTNTYDPDALAFILATGITDFTQKSAVNKLVLDYKGAGLWTKRQAIYPFVGGTAFSHKWNLKDPRDLDAAFRLIEVGTSTHNSDGVTFGTVGSYNTKYNPSVSSTINDFSFTAYCRAEVTGTYYVYIATQGGGILMQLFNKVSNLMISDMYNSAASLARVSASNTTSKGCFTASRTPTGTRHAILKNGTLLASNNTTAGTVPNGEIILNAIGSGIGQNMAFVAVGQGISDAEAATEYSIIQAFQTTLGRQV